MPYESTLCEFKTHEKFIKYKKIPYNLRKNNVLKVV